MLNFHNNEIKGKREPEATGRKLCERSSIAGLRRRRREIKKSE